MTPEAIADNVFTIVFGAVMAFLAIAALVNVVIDQVEGTRCDKCFHDEGGRKL